MNSASKKDERLEYLRVISCFLVILGHISNWYMREYPHLPMDSYVAAVFLNGICRVSVPIFFMISGALILEQTTDYKKNRKRTLFMFSKTVIWTVIYIIWDFLYLGTKFNPRTMFAEPVRAHFWFMFVMVGIYATVPFWKKLVSGDSRELLKYFFIIYIVVTTVYFFAKANKMPVAYEVPLVGGSCYTGLFIMGYAIRHYITEIKISRKTSILVIIGGTLATILLTIISTVKLGRHYEEFTDFKSVFIVLSSLSVFYLFMRLKGLKLYGWMKVISKYSFGIYMTHVFFLDILQQNIDVTKINFFLGAPIFFIILLVTSLGFSWLYEKIKCGHQAI